MRHLCSPRQPRGRRGSPCAVSAHHRRRRPGRRGRARRPRRRPGSRASSPTGWSTTTQFDVDDYGLTIDFGLGLDDVGGHAAPRHDDQPTRWPTNVDNYTTGVDFGTVDIYAGPTAKAAVLAQSPARDPRASAGSTSSQRLEARVTDAGRSPAASRTERSTDDFANSSARRSRPAALTEAGSREGSAGADVPARAAVLRASSASTSPKQDARRPDLRRRQRPDRRPPTPTSPRSPSSSCSALPTQPTVTRRRRQRPTAWLGAQQNNGSFGGGPSTEASNTNSTGLAAWALGDVGARRRGRAAALGARPAGRRRRLRHAARRREVVRSPTTGRAAGRRRPTASPTRPRDQWRRATGPGAAGARSGRPARADKLSVEATPPVPGPTRRCAFKTFGLAARRARVCVSVNGRLQAASSARRAAAKVAAATMHRQHQAQGEDQDGRLGRHDVRASSATDRVRVTSRLLAWSPRSSVTAATPAVGAPRRLRCCGACAACVRRHRRGRLQRARRRGADQRASPTAAARPRRRCSWPPGYTLELRAAPARASSAGSTALPARRPVRQHAAGQRLLGPVVVRRQDR